VPPPFSRKGGSSGATYASGVDPQTCARCGEPLPSGARFCPNCGAPVSVPAASERRVVTVVFADLAGSTELAARLDPERFREVLAAFHEMASDRIHALGGRAEGFIGDAVLGVFGVPVVHDDDAERGIRAALQIVDRAERIGSRLGLAAPIRVRVGVNTGPVAIGTPSDRNLVVGAEVNAGARLQQAAEPGEVLVGATTHQLALGNVEFTEPRRIAAKGFDEELRAWPALRMTPRSPLEANALVDRRRELALLDDTFERVRERSRAHLVTLLGEPGIGKSRVVQEFLSRLPGDVGVMEGRASPFEEEVTFLPLAQMVYRAIGEERGASDEVVIERLRNLVDGWVGEEEADVAVRRLGLAVGLGEEGSEENRYHAAEVRSGVLTLVTGLAKGGPVVVVFEDVHEADPLLLDLIEQLVKEARRLPLMVVCVARWEFLQDQPAWAGGIADAVTLWVESLPSQDAVELAMAAGDLPRGDAERVAEHAGGNPFFLVEITAMLRREGRGVAPARVGGAAGLLPPTVQAVVAARIDQLSPGARELVRHASVFPLGHFDLDDLSIIVEPRKDLLAEAEEDELLVADDDRSGRWRFRSDVLRDVAYESLAKRERQRLHLRVANKLSEAEEADRYPRTVAYHLEHAALAALDLNPGDRTLAERAVEALSRAGDIARQRIESRAAADLYERALALAGDHEAWGTREARILSMHGEARYWLGEFDLAEESLRRALGLEGDDEIEAHAARFLADISLTIRGDDHLAAALFDRALIAARRLGSSYVLARTLLMAAWVPYRRGELKRSEAMFREALEVARGGERPDAWAVSRALSGLATTTSMDGDERVALDLATEGLEIGDQAGQAFTVAIAHGAVASSLRRMLRLDEALEHSDAAVRTLRELGARWELASALGDRGAVHRLAGRPDDAESDLREAFLLCRALNERALVGWTGAELSRLLATRGDTAGARATLSEPAVRTAEGEPGSATALLMAEAVLALAEGDRESALSKSVASIEAEADGRGAGNSLAAQVWWTGRLFGDDAAGGTARVEEARELLHHNGWNQALREPDLVEVHR
jgi:class 3 adenylate cyclase/tetratricopeptide (TPR) repeat protein